MSTPAMTSARRLLAGLRDRQTLGLVAALAAGGALLVLPSGQEAPPSAVPAAVAWPDAQTASIPATLADGAPYEPELFLDARRSVGTSPSPDGASLRLMLRGADGSARPLRSRPQAGTPSFGNVTATGDQLAWTEGSGGGPLQLWTVNLGDGRPARLVTADTGDFLAQDSQYDLSITGGRLYWTAADRDSIDVVELRSVAVAGGPVQVSAHPGTWRLSAWPWLVNGATTPGGTTGLRNVVTREEVAVEQPPGLASTHCSPTWCQVVRQTEDGSTQTGLQRPDGADRQLVPGGELLPAIGDVAPLDRFEVLIQAGPDSELTRTGPLVVYEIPTRRTVQLSPNAATIAYRQGVLWWSNTTQDTTTWHTIDLRTVEAGG
jgi:hypothetical protein